MTISVRPRRSVLYMPGSNPRALEKARSLPADALILDLEDAVAPGEKEIAREQVREAVAARGFGSREVAVRINGLDTQWGTEDLLACIAARPDAVLVPKVSCAADLEAVADAMSAADADDGIALWAMMETPLAILNAGEIAAYRRPDAPLEVLVMGTNDLAKETGARLTRDRLPLIAWLSTCVAAARAHGRDIVDGVYNDFRDLDGLKAECDQGRALGMDGKTLIHPGQIESANAAFSPSAEEIDEARRILAAFDRPENAGKGAIDLDGRMVERLHAEVARRTLALAEAIGDTLSNENPSIVTTDHHDRRDNCADNDDLLYHYSDINALVGIIRTKEFWASDFRFMNDSQEVVFYRDIMDDEIKEQLQFHGRLDLHGDMISPDFREIARNIFICSFSEDGNLLSQWRAYASRNGISIGFSKKHLSNIMEQNALQFDSVTYDTDLCKKKIRESVKEFLEQDSVARALIHNEKPDEFLSFRLGFFNINYMFHAANQLPFLKHEAFSEEREWRAVSFDIPHNENTHFRNGNNVQIPYKAISLIDQNVKTKPIDIGIRTITFGPNCDIERCSVACEMAFRNFGIIVPRYYESTIPFVG